MFMAPEMICTAVRMAPRYIIPCKPLRKFSHNCTRQMVGWLYRASMTMCYRCPKPNGMNSAKQPGRKMVGGRLQAHHNRGVKQNSPSTNAPEPDLRWKLMG